MRFTTRLTIAPARIDLAFAPAAFFAQRQWLCKNSGSYWKYYKDMVELIERLGPERATLTFYETLQTDFDAEVTRLADFLGERQRI